MKIFLLLILAFSFFGCDLERENPLDPKNSENTFKRVNLLELFVRTDTSFPYSDYALTASETLSNNSSLKNQVGDFIVLQFHVNDDLALEQNLSHYQTRSKNQNAGVPDLFLNGNENRAQGASSVENALKHYEQILREATLSEVRNAEFFLVCEAEKNGNTIKVSLEIANTSSKAKEDLLLKGVVVANKGLGKNFTVVAWFSKKTISLENGKVAKFEFETSIPTSEPTQTIIWIEENEQVKQAISIEN
ncbi:hypothetical protein IT568_07955 [bacterium]|nr:hypothetical protein [bacterium]